MNYKQNNKYSDDMYENTTCIIPGIIYMRNPKPKTLNTNLDKTKNVYSNLGKKLFEKLGLKQEKLAYNKAVKIEDLNKGKIRFFRSNEQAADYLNVSEETISEFLHNNKLYKDRYKVSIPSYSDYKNLQFFISLYVNK